MRDEIVPLAMGLEPEGTCYPALVAWPSADTDAEQWRGGCERNWRTEG